MSTIRALTFAIIVLIIGSNSRGGETRFERKAYALTQPVLAVDAVDANGDGKLDLIAVGESKVWAVLQPSGDKVVLVEDTAGRMLHGCSLDCDADGDLDVVMSRSTSNWIFHRNAIATGRSPKEPTGGDWTIAWIENIGTTDREWPLHVVDRELHGVHGVTVGDVDRDGADDLLAGTFRKGPYQDSLAWFDFPIDASREDLPGRTLISKGEAKGRAHYLDFADMNGDSRGDLLLGASGGGTLTWWEQPAESVEAWQKHLIARMPGATHPRAVDMNGDSRRDVLASAGHGEGVAWFEAPDWIRHDVDSGVRDVHAFDVADLDGDGDIDCAGCSFSMERVWWWENQADGTFTAHELDNDGGQQAYDLKIKDVDGDGGLDILLAGRQTKNVVWYRNVGREDSTSN
ncbi:FG-GAP repeat domain-containing protein [Stratiformator vulcanicus]|uniref:FG-GAP repeat protein n=1 Tax=Stratiformator vulcanicus TaxID=2527980 RepID=A0A517R3L8_9PLAN|nr:VCBS repeat-containing protein [Stratiformator vulcanicus]QDT38471.1 FG-GAP repeat protein [Stratiformator vulcanicus]